MDLIARVVSRHVEAMAFPREFYLPSHLRGEDPINPKGTDLFVWTWEDEKGTPYGVAFAGRAKKPLWNYRFRNDDQRQRRIDESAKSRRDHLDRKEQDLKEKREFQHGLSKGDILSSSWGYDQTNVDFYQVTAVKGKLVEVREIASKVVRSGQGADYVTAVPNKFIGSALKRRPTGKRSGEPMVKIDSSSRAYPWDGKPKYQTGAGYGH